MIELKFSATCLQCPYISVTSDVQVLHTTNGTPFSPVGYISCEKREVCKWYDKTAEVMNPIKKKYIFVCSGKFDEDDKN